MPMAIATIMVDACDRTILHNGSMIPRSKATMRLYVALHVVECWKAAFMTVRCGFRIPMRD